MHNKVKQVVKSKFKLLFLSGGYFSLESFEKNEASLIVFLRANLSDMYILNTLS